MGPEISPSEITDSHFVSLYFLKPYTHRSLLSVQDCSEIWPVSGQISVRQYVGCCLTCLLYCGAVSKSFILETLVENLSLLFLGKIFLNTLSSVFTGRLLFCCDSLTSWTVRRSTRDLTFLRSRNLVQPSPGCSWPGFCPSAWGQFCSVLLRTD